MLRRIFGPESEEVKGEWRRLHKNKLYALNPSPNIRVIKSRRLRWAGYVARMGKTFFAWFWWGNLREGDNVQGPSLDKK
jgi:hypothetical protein